MAKDICHDPRTLGFIKSYQRARVPPHAHIYFGGWLAMTRKMSTGPDQQTMKIQLVKAGSDERGDVQYTEISGTVDAASLNGNDAWTIKGPSDELAWLLADKATLRVHKDGERFERVLVSHGTPSRKIVHPTATTGFDGAICVVHDEAKENFLVVAGSKLAVRNVSCVFGLGKESGTEEVMARVLWYEAGLRVSPSDLCRVGHMCWRFRKAPATARGDWAATTVLFAVTVPTAKMRGLAAQAVVSGNDIEAVAVVSADAVRAGAPIIVHGETLTGHHLETLRRFLGLAPQADCAGYELVYTFE